MVKINLNIANVNLFSNKIQQFYHNFKIQSQLRQVRLEIFRPRLVDQFLIILVLEILQPLNRRKPTKG